jgi:hypothetical protein
LEYHAEHGHIHLNDWAQMRLVKPTPVCALPNRSPTPCIAKSGPKLSFCIRDEEDFDDAIGSVRRYTSCETKQQGISSGKRDRYALGLFGQFLDLQGVLGGAYWLEAEVDPGQRFVERERENNIARTSVTVPSTRCLSGAGGAWTCAPGVPNCQALDCRLYAPECCEFDQVSPLEPQACSDCKDYYCFLDPGSPACLGRFGTCD